MSFEHPVSSGTIFRKRDFEAKLGHKLAAAKIYGKAGLNWKPGNLQSVPEREPDRARRVVSKQRLNDRLSMNRPAENGAVQVGGVRMSGGLNRSRLAAQAAVPAEVDDPTVDPNAEYEVRCYMNPGSDPSTGALVAAQVTDGSQPDHEKAKNPWVVIADGVTPAAAASFMTSADGMTVRTLDNLCRAASRTFGVELSANVGLPGGGPPLPGPGDAPSFRSPGPGLPF